MKILKTHAAAFGDFEAAVKAHAEELKHHSGHMAKVAIAEQAAQEAKAIADDENKAIAAEAREDDPVKKSELSRRVAFLRSKRGKAQDIASSAQAFPAPVQHPLIDAAVKRIKQPDGTTEFVPEYELVDSIPVTKGDLVELRRRKDYLIAEVGRLETETIKAIYPPGKWRLRNLKVHDIHEDDARRRIEIGKRLTAINGDDAKRSIAIVARLHAIWNYDTKRRHAAHEAFQAKMNAYFAEMKKYAASVNAATKDGTVPLPDDFPKPPPTPMPDPDFEKTIIAGRSVDDAEFVEAHSDPGKINAAVIAGRSADDAAFAADHADSDKINAMVIAGRSDAEKAIADEHAAHEALVKKIHRHAAELQSQVEDLTEDDAHLWQPAAFPTE